MKKKGIFYILFAFLIMFGLKANVFAEQICVYKKESSDESKYYRLVKYEDTNTVQIIRVKDGNNFPFQRVASDVSIDAVDYNDCPNKIYYSNSENVWSLKAEGDSYVYNRVKSISCDYKNAAAEYFHTYTLDGEFMSTVVANSQVSTAGYGGTWRSSLTPGDFLVNEDYSCPSVCIESLTTSSRIFSYTLQNKKDKKSNNNCTSEGIVLSESKDFQENPEDDSEDAITCLSSDGNLSVTLDVQNKKILNFMGKSNNEIAIVSKNYVGSNKVVGFEDIYNTCEKKCNNFSVVDTKGYHNIIAVAVKTSTYWCKDGDDFEKYKPICGIFKKDGKLLPIIKNIYKIFKIALPVLILILTIVEFLKVLFSGEDKTMKDAFKATTTRLILLIVVVISPILIEFVIKIAGVSENCLQYFVK